VAGEDLASASPLTGVRLRIGVLALQGAFREHVLMLRRLGAEAAEVRLAVHLIGLDGLIIPGGESTTMGKLMEEFGLTVPLRAFAARHPVFGTCAGLIMLASRTTEGSQPLLGLMDITVRRNAYGRQVQSFEAPVDLRLPKQDGSEDAPGDSVGDAATTFHGVFIRAPWVEEYGPQVRAIATCEGRVVGVQQGHMLGVAFHPELTDDTRIHEYFLREVIAEAHIA
jgi:5'-phosphate synthase pdxT subunit